MMSELIDLLRYAPSGGNLQPWILKTDQNDTMMDITLYLDPGIRYEGQHTDHSGYGALISLGVLTYSIQYLCSTYGYRFLKKTIHSDRDIYKNSILINLEKCEPISSQKAEIFRNRFTDRRCYQIRPFSEDLKHHLLADSDSSLYFFDEDPKRKIITDLLSQLSLIRFQNKDLFKELSHELKLDKSASTGIPISNLGLSPLLEYITRLQKRYPLSLPFDSLYSWPLYESIIRPMKYSATIGCVKMPGKTAGAWIQVGEKIMSVWLKLCESGARMQPFGNTLCIANYFQDPDFFSFSERQRESIRTLHSEVLSELKIDTAEACIFFRAGYSNLERQETPRKKIITIS